MIHKAPKIRFLLSALIICSIAISGCGGKKADYVARIGNEYITEQDFEDRISKLPERYQDVVRANKARFLDEWIADTLLYKEALREKMNEDDEAKSVIKEATKKILIAKLLKEKIDDAVKVSDDEVRDYYDSHQDEFRMPEVRRASHIMVKTPEEAQAVLLELANGGNFEDLARSRSVDTSAVQGGDLGYFARGQLDPDFEEACFRLSTGGISDVVKSRFGYHIIKLTDMRMETVENYDDVRNRIYQNLLVGKKKKSFNDLIESLKKRMPVEINKESPALSKKASGARDDQT